MIETPISAGELLDKISILEIKTFQIVDPDKLQNVFKELHALQRVALNHLDVDKVVDQCAALRTINHKLWGIEDELRRKEVEQEFDGKFISLARDVYFTNDERAKVKREINEILGSELIEEKSYVEYRTV